MWKWVEVRLHLTFYGCWFAPTLERYSEQYQELWNLCKSTCCCRPESVEDNVLDILDSPVSEKKTVPSASSNQRVSLSAQRSPSKLILNTCLWCLFISCASERSVAEWHNPLRVSPSLSLCLTCDLSGDRPVWNHRETAGELWYDRSAVCLSSVFIITVAFVHQGSRIDEQRCVFPLPLKVSLK